MRIFYLELLLRGFHTPIQGKVRIDKTAIQVIASPDFPAINPIDSTSIHKLPRFCVSSVKTLIISPIHRNPQAEGSLHLYNKMLQKFSMKNLLK